MNGVLAGFGCALVAALAGCAHDSHDVAPNVSGQAQTLALSADESVVWVASPDDDSVVAYDAESLVPVGRMDGIAAASRLAWFDARLAVIGQAMPAVALLSTADPRRPQIVHTWPIPCNGADQFTVSGNRAWITCGDDLRLVAIDLRSGEVEAIVRVDRPIEAIATSGGTVWLTKAGALHGLEESDLLDGDTGSVRELGGAPGLDLGANGRIANRASILLPRSAGPPTVVVQRVEADVDRTRPAESSDYGRVHDGNPRLQPWFVGPCSGGYAVYDGGDRTLAGAHSAAQSGDRIWVTHRFTNNVALLACHPNADGESAVVWAQTARVGAGAAGIVVSRNGERAWVDVAFDGALTRIDLQGNQLVTSTGRREVRPTRLSTAAQAGRRLFHDATRPQLTPAGVVACASCHPEGGEDGVSWFIRTPEVAPRFRRTPPVWTVSLGTPLHWDGEFVDSDALVSATITQLMSGTGRLIDVASISAYMRELPSPEPPLPLDAGEAACRERGRSEYRSAGCTTCHEGPWATDGRLHAVRVAAVDPAGIMGPVRTPTLVGVRARGPWLHDGSAGTLRDLWASQDPDGMHGTAAMLDGNRLDDLLCYVESL